ncbi:DUF2730 family protein [Roseibium sp.]|uniref:DUF2730 family protein n=1 Tax=Roseibium sp. TaxID=1936156 RepID=UPI003D0ED552
MIEDIKNWLAVFNTAGLIVLGVYGWLTARAKGNSEHLQKVDNKLIEHDRRIQSVESELKHMPDKDDVHDLKLALAELRGTVGRLDESLSGVSRTVRRVEEHLTNGGH